VWVSSSYILSVMIVVFMFVLPGLFRNAIWCFVHHDNRGIIWFDIYQGLIYHTITHIASIILLVVCPYKLNAYKDMLKGMTPIVCLLITSYVCSCAIHFIVDAYSDPSYSMVKWIYDGTGHNWWVANFVIMQLSLIMFIGCYYIYWFISVLIPKLLTRKNISVK
jgi:hypothetical protein